MTTKKTDLLRTLQLIILFSTTQLFLFHNKHNWYDGNANAANGRFLSEKEHAPSWKLIYATNSTPSSSDTQVVVECTNNNNHEAQHQQTIQKEELLFPNDNSLEDFLNASTSISESGKDRIRHLASNVHNDSQPLRHVLFSDLQLPTQSINSGPPMTTAFQESTVVSQASWFPRQKICQETCCAQAVAISLEQDDHHIINAVDGQDLADVMVYGQPLWPHHVFAGSELTDDVIPCLQPGVILHVDSYRGPIARFFRILRPKIKVPYVLITTRSDGVTPHPQFSKRLDTDPQLLAWYGINPSYHNYNHQEAVPGANHSKFRMMHLGLIGKMYRQQPFLNYLNQARNYSNPFGGDKSRWMDPSVWDTARDTTRLLFVHFGIHKNAPQRSIPWAMACNNRTEAPLDDNISCHRGVSVTPEQIYAAASKYPFGLSPPGNGPDCYRTYELLLNGAIPVVQARREYNELFRDLPVLQLPHWNYTQPELVTLMHDYVHSPAFWNQTFDAGWNRLFFRHWRRQVLQDAGRLDEIIKDDQGKEYFTSWQYSWYRKPNLPEHEAAIQKKQQQRKEQADGEMQ